MKSGKQRKAEIVARRSRRDEVQKLALHDPNEPKVSPRTVACEPENLALNLRFYPPSFVDLGYYADIAFQCASCGKQEIWTATQQKWWYEVAKGAVDSNAKHCNPCRKVERERKAEARRTHLAGLAAKVAKRNAA